MPPSSLHRSARLAALGLLVGLSGSAFAEGTVALKPPAEATFDATGPAGFKIHGTTSEVELLEGEALTVRVRLSALETGIALRDSHLRDKYLEVAKYPHADFTVKGSDVKWDAAGALTGTFALHGKSKPLTVNYTARRNGNHSIVEGNGTLDFRDFGIDVPSYMGVTVKPNIRFAVKFEVVHKTPAAASPK